MPKQLRLARRPKRLNPRPRIDDLPRVCAARIGPHVVWFCGFRVHWIRTGLGYLRPQFECHCGRRVRYLYHFNHRLMCSKCVGGIYVSQTKDRYSRPKLQMHRLARILADSKGLHATTDNRLARKFIALGGNKQDINKAKNNQVRLLHSFGIQQ